MTEDQDIWSLYAKGVRKMGAAQETAPPPKIKHKEIPTAEVLKQAPVDQGPIPEAWQKQMAQEEGLTAGPEETSPKAPKQEPVQSPVPTPPSPPTTPWRREPLDLRVERNLSLGDVVIEARLDLHGKTEEEAHEALNAFIEKQQKLNRRLVLVITGRGREGEAVLRTNVPRWCDVAPLYDKILAIRTAAPHHGGDGALYVLLRRQSHDV